MKKKYFKDCKDVASYMYLSASSGTYIVAALYYDEAIEVLKHLMRHEDVDVELLDIAPVDYDNYNKEYYISITEDLVVNAEKSMFDNKYLKIDADCILIDANASSSIIINEDQNICREIYIGEKNFDFIEDENVCKKCKECESKADDLDLLETLLLLLCDNIDNVKIRIVEK